MMTMGIIPLMDKYLLCCQSIFCFFDVFIESYIRSIRTQSGSLRVTKMILCKDLSMTLA